MTRPGVDVRSRTPLLTLITQESMDEGYEHAARRREESSRAGADAAPRRATHWAATAVVAAFGVLVAVAAVQTSARSNVADASRASLLGQIDTSRGEVAALQKRIVRLRGTNVGLRDDLDAVSAQERAASARVRRTGAWSGFGAVTGPGVRITVNDAADGEAVRDDDLALLVNGLWQAGAEAIAINGKRLTVRSALRNSGAAINVNGPPPLSPPYVISAIGDPRTLQADLTDTTTGLEFDTLADSLGFRVSMDNVERLTLPAGPQRQLRLRSAEALVQGASKKKSGRSGVPGKGKSS